MKYRVKLRGWPEGVKFGSPYQIGKIADLEALKDALRSGECKWVKIKPDEYRELEKRLEAEESEPRQPRSDKGGKRKRADEDVDNGAQGRPGNAKRQKAAQKQSKAAMKKIAKQLPETLKKVIKSKAFVTDTDDESSEGESDDEGSTGGSPGSKGEGSDDESEASL